jgi:hypothetical protein
VTKTGKSFGGDGAAVSRIPAGAGFDTLFLLPVKAAGMELDGETVKQILVAVLAVAFFIGATVVASSAFGSHPAINESVDATIDGTLSEGAVSGDTVDGTFNGTFDADLSGSVERVNGTIEGTLQDGRVTGTFEGEASGTVTGTVTGSVNASYNASANSLSGEFTGTINGTDASTTFTPQGGIALVALLAAFILLIAGAGLWLERQDFDSDS